MLWTEGTIANLIDLDKDRESIGQSFKVHCMRSGKNTKNDMLLRMNRNKLMKPGYI